MSQLSPQLHAQQKLQEQFILFREGLAGIGTDNSPEAGTAIGK
jgi:hypothetical protein